MRKSATKAQAVERWYDFFDDWELIEASLFQQYGLRIRQEYKTISWKEVCTLVSGLLPETPLGKVVAIRSEKDKKVLKSYTPQLREIRNKWINKMAQERLKDPQALEREFSDWEFALAKMFSE